MQCLDSNISVSDNEVAGEATGNAATNTVSAEATSVTGATGNVTLDPTTGPSFSNAGLAIGNQQNNGFELETNIAATFGIIDDQADIDEITNSSQALNSNQLFSDATANIATNSVEVKDTTTTNTDATTALENVQTPLTIPSRHRTCRLWRMRVRVIRLST